MLRNIGLLVLLLFPSFGLIAENFSPIDFGIFEANTDIERYFVLYKTHQAAIKANCGVTYEGLDRIEIEIPKTAEGIPLSLYTDFAGVELSVRNTQKKTTLFILSQDLKETGVKKEQIDNADFSDNPELEHGLKLLVIEDETPWVAKRTGYNYGATRKDILLLENGKAFNEVVSCYSDESSSPKCFFCDVPQQQVLIKDLQFTRTEDSSQMTRLFNIRNQNNVLIQNISVTTPSESELYGDAIISVVNCANLSMEDVMINGTYSKPDKFGYGISMDNVWNSRFVRLKATGNWGVFGNSNVNYATIEDSDINRFDVHCYGRDIYCSRTIFRDYYNQFSSLYGDLVFNDCQFIDFIPVLFESSYSAYTPFNLILKGCTIICDRKSPYLINAGRLSAPKEGVRQELHASSWPNITLKDVNIYLPEGENVWTLFYVSGKSFVSAEYIDHITIKSVQIIPGVDKDPEIKFSNNNTRTAKSVQLAISDSTIESIEF